MNTTHVIKGPLITEKLDRAREKFRQYSFLVDHKATKHDVADTEGRWLRALSAVDQLREELKA